MTDTSADVAPVYLDRKHFPKSVSPEPDRLMVDIDVPFVQ